MAWFGRESESEKQARIIYKREKNAKFEGTCLQSVGIIPKGGEVSLSLDPDNEMLIVTYNKEVNVKLPYARVIGFSLECETSSRRDDKMNFAGSILSTGLLGRGVVGTVGQVAGNMMKMLEKQKVIWIGTLVYRDKTGEIKELAFAERARELEYGEEPYKYRDDEEFEYAVSCIVMRYNKELLEL